MLGIGIVQQGNGVASQAVQSGLGARLGMVVFVANAGHDCPPSLDSA